MHLSGSPSLDQRGIVSWKVRMVVPRVSSWRHRVKTGKEGRREQWRERKGRSGEGAWGRGRRGKDGEGEQWREEGRSGGRGAWGRGKDGEGAVEGGRGRSGGGGGVWGRGKNGEGAADLSNG